MTRRKSILITGATGRIGTVLVKHFLLSGWSVIASSRSTEGLQKLHDNLSTAPIENLIEVEIDLSEENAARKLTQYLVTENALPVALVNAARDRSSARFDKHGVPVRDTWMQEYLMNVVVPCELSLVLADQPDSPLCSIVNIASMYGMVAINPQLHGGHMEQWPAHYGCAKAAMIHLTRELAARLSHLGIKVNSVSYGGVEGRVDADFAVRYAQMCPQGRMLKDADLPGIIDFLVSDAASGMTGTNIPVDSGWTIW